MDIQGNKTAGCTEIYLELAEESTMWRTIGNCLPIPSLYTIKLDDHLGLNKITGPDLIST